MRHSKLWLYSAALLLAGCGQKGPSTTVESLRRLPAADASFVRIDVDALRRGGLLKAVARGTTQVEPEYQSFLSGTGFDYERDLDEAVGAFGPAGTYLVLRGRFDWPKLEAYAGRNGGSCYDKLCRMPGSVPERRISFLPLSKNVMALAVGTDDLAASKMTKEQPPLAFDVPDRPVWIRTPGSVLRKGAGFPPATRLFTSSLGVSQSVTLTVGPAASSAYELKLDALCRTPEEARVMTVQLTKMTEMLKGFSGKSKRQDLGSLAASGSFSQSGVNVLGVWGIPRELVESLAGGN